MSVDVKLAIDELVDVCHEQNQHFWTDLHTGEDLRCANRIVPEKLMLIVSELAEAMEAHRKNLMDSHLPTHRGITVELADALIRIFDLAGAMNYDLGTAVYDKLLYNQYRADHKKEARLAPGGKAY